MSFDPSNLPLLVNDYYGNKDHPDIPGLKVKDYEAFARVAARMHGEPNPSPAQVEVAFHSLKSAEIAPAEFERLWDVAKPLSNRLLGRDPSIHELTHLSAATPEAIHGYYMNHPHPDYPEVKAGDFITYHAVAEPIARVVGGGRSPNGTEVRRFVLGKYTADDMVRHYGQGS